MNSAFFDEGQAVRVARLADVKADYQVSDHTSDGLVIHPIESSFDVLHEYQFPMARRNTVRRRQRRL